MTKLLMLFVSCFFSLNLFAGGFFEPSLGYSVGNYKDKDKNFLTYKDEGFAKGVALGFRGGYSGDLIFFGADIAFRIMVLEAEYYNSDSNAGFVGIQPGLIAGIHVPFLPLRVWAGIYGGVLANSDEQTVLLQNVKWTRSYSGSVFKLGAGLNILPLLSINLEYSVEKMNKVESELEINGVKQPKDTIEFEKNEPTISTVTVSLSIPIEFWKGSGSSSTGK